MTCRISIRARQMSGNFAALCAVAFMPGVRVMIASAEQAEVEAVRAELAKLGLATVRSVQTFRDLVCSLDQHSGPALIPETLPRPAPKFGGSRPYLKRKKGRS